MLTRQMKKGEVFSITLATNASTGYIWQLEDQENFAIVETKWPAPVNIGGALDVEYVIIVKNEGEFMFRINKVRPWEPKNVVDRHEEKIFVS